MSDADSFFCSNNIIAVVRRQLRLCLAMVVALLEVVVFVEVGSDFIVSSGTGSVFFVGATSNMCCFAC